MSRKPSWLVGATLGLFGVMASLPVYPPGTNASPPPMPQPVRSETAASEWKLVWSDEFNGPEIDRNKWDLERGSGFMAPGTNEWLAGWGNNELEFYSKRPENARIQDGMLHVRAIKEVYKGCEYTSARLTTRDRFSKKYGRFEFRAKLPTGKGILPRYPSCRCRSLRLHSDRCSR